MNYISFDIHSTVVTSVTAISTTGMSRITWVVPRFSVTGIHLYDEYERVLSRVGTITRAELQYNISVRKSRECDGTRRVTVIKTG